MVFIGKNLDKEFIEQGVEECKAKPLRFEVGQRVKCNLGKEWAPGTIVKQWWEGAPYQVKLDKKGTLIQVPIDTDVVCVKLED